jgi:hypothetical protein
MGNILPGEAKAVTGKSQARSGNREAQSSQSAGSALRGRNGPIVSREASAPIMGNILPGLAKTVTGKSQAGSGNREPESSVPSVGPPGVETAQSWSREASAPIMGNIRPGQAKAVTGKSQAGS